MKTSGCHHCGENRYLRKETRKNRTGLRILAFGLALSMLLTGCGPASVAPLTVPGGVEQVEAALQQGNGDNGTTENTDAVITGFGSLPDEVREQNVPLGTNIEELTLPDTLEAYVKGKNPENEGGG